MSYEHFFEVKHVENPAEMLTVNLKDHICSCRKWELTGIPCVHALACIKSRNFKFEVYIPECYRKSRYMAVYKPVLYPVNGSNLWVKHHIQMSDLQSIEGCLIDLKRREIVN